VQGNRKVSGIHRVASKLSFNSRLDFLAQMIRVLADGLQPHAAKNATRHDNASATLCDAWWLVHERVPFVAREFSRHDIPKLALLFGRQA